MVHIKTALKDGLLVPSEQMQESNRIRLIWNIQMFGINEVVSYIQPFPCILCLIIWTKLNSIAHKSTKYIYFTFYKFMTHYEL